MKIHTWNLVVICAIAAVAQSANKAWCAANGDFSQTDWDTAPEWQKQSLIDGVRFHLDNPDASPSASHDNWLKHKKGEGWVYGEEKCAEKRTHPCILPFEDLPFHNRAKDILFRSIVHSLSGC